MGNMTMKVYTHYLSPRGRDLVVSRMPVGGYVVIEDGRPKGASATFGGLSFLISERFRPARDAVEIEPPPWEDQEGITQ